MGHRGPEILGTHLPFKEAILILLKSKDRDQNVSGEVRVL